MSKVMMGFTIKMLHPCNIWCTTIIGRNPSGCKGSEAFFMSFRFEKNNLAESVTFLLYAIIDSLSHLT